MALAGAEAEAEAGFVELLQQLGLARHAEALAQERIVGAGVRSGGLDILLLIFQYSLLNRACCPRLRYCTEFLVEHSSYSQ